jgi:hypothetical protein
MGERNFQMIFEITEAELMQYPFSYHAIFNLLRDKGAPIVGFFSPRVKPGYQVTETINLTNRTIMYHFQPRSH